MERIDRPACDSRFSETIEGVEIYLGENSGTLVGSNVAGALAVGPWVGSLRPGLTIIPRASPVAHDPE
jgi:hypothetical protein